MKKTVITFITYLVPFFALLLINFQLYAQAPTVSDVNRCGAGTAVLTAAGAPVGGSYRWYNVATGGTPIVGANAASFTTPTLTTTTDFFVSSVAADGTTESGRTKATVNIRPLPIAQILEGAIIGYCTTTTITLNAFNVSGATYQWQRFTPLGGGSFQNETGPGSTTTTYNVSSPTAGFFRIAVTGTNGCTAFSPVIEVVTNYTPEAIILQGATGTICLGQSFLLQAKTDELSVGNTYQWTFSANNTTFNNVGGATTSSLSATQAGFYKLQATKNNCVATSPAIQLTQSPSPTATIQQGMVANLCAGGNTILTAQTDIGTQFQWLVGLTAAGPFAPASGASTGMTYSANSSGFYVVEIGKDGCTTRSAPTQVTQEAAPVAQITNISPTSFCAGGSITLNAQTVAGNTYQWKYSATAGGTFANIAGANTANYTTTQSGFYVLEVKKTGCTLVDTSAPIEVRETKAVIQEAPTASLCKGTSTTLNAVTLAGATYRWLFSPTAGGTFSNASGTNNNPTYTTNVIGYYRLDVTRDGCTHSSVPVNVIEKSATIAQGASTTFCRGSDALLIADQTGGGLTYAWTYSTTLTGTYSAATGTNNAATYSANKVGFYKLTVIDGSCTNTSDPISLTESPIQPIAIILQGSTAQFCIGGDVTINTIQQTGAIYSWKYSTSMSGTYAPATGTNNTATYVANTAGFYTVQVTNGGCSVTSLPINVTQINMMPKPTISQGATAFFCTAGNVKLQNTLIMSGVTYQWQYSPTAGGVYSPASGINNTVDYNTNQEGFYKIRITSTTCGTNISDAVEVRESTNLPIAKILQTSPAQFCAAGDVTLEAQTGVGYAYQWQYATTATGAFANASGTNTLASYSANQVGFYRVQVTLGGCVITSTPIQTQLAAAAPKPTIEQGTSASFCDGGSVNINTTMKGTGYTYQWQFATTATGTFANASGTSTNATYAVNTVGFYRVVVTIPNCGSSTSDNIQITQSSQKPVAIILQGSTAVFCVGSDVILDAVQGAGFAYQWKFSATPTGTYANATGTSSLANYTASIAGFYTVEVSLNGCSETSLPIAVTSTTVMPKPVISQGANAAFCEGSSLALTAQTRSSKYTYRWEFATTATGTYSPASGINNRDSYPVSTAGFYRLVTTSATCGSATSDVTQVKVSTVIPTAKISQGTSAVFCAGADVVLDAETGTGYTYNWQFAATATGTFTDAVGDNKKSTYPASTAGFYRVIVGFDGCSATSTAISVTSTATMPKPVIAQGSTVTFCVGGNITLSALTKSTKYTYQWLFSTTATGTYANASGSSTADSYATSQAGFYKLRTTSATCGTADSEPTELRQTTEKPKAVIIQAPTAQFCSNGGDVILEAEQEAGYSYRWRFSTTAAGTYSNAAGTNNQASYATNVAGFYVVEVSLNACVATSEPVQVSGTPTMPQATTVQTGVVQICKGESTTLSAKSKGTNYQYQWLYSASASGTFANASGSSNTPNYTASVSGFYRLRTSLPDCGTSTSATVQIKEASFIPSPTILQAPSIGLCSGGDVSLEVTPEPEVSYTWFFSDRRDGIYRTAEGNSKDALYNAAKVGFYKVSAALGACIKTSEAVEVRAITTLPEPTITPKGKIFFCKGGSAELKSLYKGTKVTYQWQFSASATGTFTNANNGTVANFSATQAGFYKLTISATGCGSATSTVIEVAETTVLPVANILQGRRAEFCVNGGDVLLEAETNPSYNYQWKFAATADSAFVNAAGASNQATYLTSRAGLYVLEISVNGCKATSQAVQVVGVTTLSKPNILQGLNVAFCEGSVPTLQTTTKGTGYVYRWTFSTSATGNFEPVSGNANVATYNNATAGFYRLEISRDGCGSNISDVISVTFKPNPTLTFSTPKMIETCEGANVQLGVNEISGAAYSWRGANNFTSSLSNPIIKASGDGFYVLTISANGCSATDSVLVKIKGKTSFTATVSDNICANERNGIIRLSSTATNLQYRLGTTGNFQVVTSFNSLAVGTYTVFSKNEFGCESTQTVNIKSSKPAGQSVNAGSDVSIQKGRAAKLLASGVKEYKWTPIVGLSDPTIADPVANPLRTTTYTVTGKDETGCETFDEVVVTVNDNGDLVITNLMTPDNNGINDTWEIVNIDLYPDAEIKVFDRWGLEVFSTVGYNNTWNGKSKSGDSVPDGAYYYQISVTIKGQRQVFSGAMNIMR